MRGIFLLGMLIFSLMAKSQTALSGGYLNRLQYQPFAADRMLNDSMPDKKWFVTSSVGISSSVIFSKGGSAFVQSVPFSIQLNRKLNNNWYAFAGLTAAPSYVNFNQSFMSANPNKSFQNYGMLQNNHLDVYGRAEAGLMYMNDQKTFSISGSIIVERSTDPFMPYNQMGTRRRPQTFTSNNGGLQ